MDHKWTRRGLQKPVLWRRGFLGPSSGTAASGPHTMPTGAALGVGLQNRSQCPASGCRGETAGQHSQGGRRVGGPSCYTGTLSPEGRSFPLQWMDTASFHSRGRVSIARSAAKGPPCSARAGQSRKAGRLRDRAGALRQA